MVVGVEIGGLNINPSLEKPNKFPAQSKIDNEIMTSPIIKIKTAKMTKEPLPLALTLFFIIFMSKHASI